MNKKSISIGLVALISMILPVSLNAEDKGEISVFKNVVFYDGYQPKIIDADVNDGILRFKNSLYSVKLNKTELKDIGDDLKMSVIIGALCDNYDRIGNVNLALVPAGAETYKYEDVERIEITRFITPFMDKNRQPTEVPYLYDIPNVGKILRDADLNGKYDFWMEFELFGIPYAANEQITGCKDRQDVFEGTIDLKFTPSEVKEEKGNILVPIYVKRPEDHGNVNFNNYKEGATDTLGVTTRTFEFEIPEDVKDSRIYLIMTNHGAANNGEEYIRRHHLVYYDGEVMLSYTPGGVSCEPYRKYNTQGNGIYSYMRPPSFWKNYSNWCPGQAVPIREIALGAQKAGKHKVMIRVPDAVFYGKDGDFRPSIYFHGSTTGEMPAGLDQIWLEGPDITYSLNRGVLNYTSSERIAELMFHHYDGRLITVFANPEKELNVEFLEKGTYILTFVSEDGRTTARKVLVK